MESRKGKILDMSVHHHEIGATGRDRSIGIAAVAKRYFCIGAVRRIIAIAQPGSLPMPVVAENQQFRGIFDFTDGFVAPAGRFIPRTGRSAYITVDSILRTLETAGVPYRCAAHKTGRFGRALPEGSPGAGVA